MKDFHDRQMKVDSFAELLASIESTADKKKMLWLEIYENALTDRENAAMLFTDAYKDMKGGLTDHAMVGTLMAKYLERMCKSNDQILRLSELIAKAEEQGAKLNSDEIFSQINGG
jgi:hypothetical protein